MAEEWDGEIIFSLTNTSKDHLHVKQLLQKTNKQTKQKKTKQKKKNNFWMLAEDPRYPERQTNLFEMK